MFCPKCGRENADGNNFCRYCGASLAEETAQAAPTPTPQPTPEPTPQPTPTPEPTPQPTPTPEPVFTPTPAPQPEADFSTQPAEFDFSLEQPGVRQNTGAAPIASPIAIRNALASPVLLVALITFSVSFLFDLFGLFDLPYLLSDYGYYGMDEWYAVSMMSVFSSLLTIAPSALLLAGFWVTYGSAKAGNPKTAGLTMIKVALIIEMVFLCVIFGLMEIILLLGSSMISFGGSLTSSFGYGVYGYDDFGLAAMQGVFFVVMIFVAAALVLSIIFFVKAVKTAGVIRETVATGVPSDRVSGFVAVFLFIIAGLAASSFLSLMFLEGIFSMLGSACSITGMICLGIFLFSYRSKMRALMTGAQSNS